jgi:membrane-bound lytic murein transglycosylase B
VVAPGEHEDARQTTDLEAATAITPVRQRRRPSGITLPALVFAALLVAGVAVGMFVIPTGGSQPSDDVAAPPAAGSDDESAPPTEPSLPTLPTPPARAADQLANWAIRVGQVLDVPDVAIQAYGYAQLEVARTDPQCHLTWTTLAGVGEVESKHGQVNGATLQRNGRSSPAIVGPLLDGQQGRPLVRDTDAGAFDGDAVYDRAMGPLRLMPALWRLHAIDADGDAILDPYDIDDAALALGRLLCSGDDDLAVLTGWRAALTRYRSGSSYSGEVFKVADDYGRRTRTIA